MNPLLAVALLLGAGEPAVEVAPVVNAPVAVTPVANAPVVGIPVEVVAPECGLVFALPKGNCGPLLQPYHPQAGDLVLFRLNNPIYQVSYHLSLSGGVMHAAIVAESPQGGLVLVEARPFKGVHLADLATRVRDCNGTVLVRRRTTPLTDEQSHALTEYLFAQMGKDFDYLGMFTIPFRLPVCVLTKGKCEPTDAHRRWWCCTSLIACACIHAGLMNAETVNPFGICAGDLEADDLFLDLGWGWRPAVPITTNCPR